MSKLWLDYKNWLKLEIQNRVYRYMSNMYRYKLAKNDQNTMCTGTSSNCTGTSLRKVPRMVFSPFFSICLIPTSTLHFKNTSKPFQIHFGISFLFNSSLNYISFFQKHIKIPSKTILIWVKTQTQTNYDD